MNKGGRKRFRLNRWKIAVVMLGLYGVAVVGYFHVPWSLRERIYRRVPRFDRAMMRSGFRLMQGWDELALLGKDAEVVRVDGFRGDLAYAGFPVFGEVTLLENRGYAVGYSESSRNPLWVAYRIFDVPELSYGKRSSFRIDHRTRAKVRTSDYTHSGFDRGHMAPNYGIATRYGAEAQRETFLMSNVIPQTPYVNRRIWKDLEMRVAKRYGHFFGEVWVITGPIFDGHCRELESGIPIPSHYYKIVIDENNGKLRAMAFLVEQRCPPYTRIKTCLVSVDRIETLTGIDFFPELGKEAQAQLESEPATRLWPSLIPAARYRLGF